MSVTTTPPESTMPGWYTDPENQGQLRYWDGSEWTEFRGPQTAPPARRTRDAQPNGTGPAGSPTGSGVPAPKRPWWKRRWVAIVAGIFALLTVVGALTSPENANRSSDRDGSGRAAPKPIELRGLYPADGSTVRAHSVVLGGRVSPSGATVLVNGAAARVQNGRFRHRVPLELGLNEIVVSTESPGRESQDITLDVTRVRSAEERAALQERRRQRELARDERRRQRAIEAEQQRQEEIAAATQTFSGSGSKNLGTITVDEESVLEWSNVDDPSFRMMLIYDDEFGMSVSSEAESGDTVVPAGTYPNVNVAGGQRWTITIRPR